LQNLYSMFLYTAPTPRRPWGKRFVISGWNDLDNDYNEPVPLYVDLSDDYSVAGENKRERVRNRPVRGAYNGSAYALALGDLGYVTLNKDFAIIERSPENGDGTGFLYRTN